MEPAHAKARAVDVAAAILDARPGLDQMQLHKLLYLVQAASLAWFQTPAFDDQPIQAWRLGPVTRLVAGHYKDFGTNPIDHVVSGDRKVVPSRLLWVIARIVDKYGKLSGPVLAAITKGPDSPWRRVRGDLPESADSDIEIPRELIAEFHGLNGVVPEEPSDEETAQAQAFFDGDEGAFLRLLEAAAKNHA